MACVNTLELIDTHRDIKRDQLAMMDEDRSVVADIYLQLAKAPYVRENHWPETEGKIIIILSDILN